GAFLRSSVHRAQVGWGSSMPGLTKSFANAPSKAPLRSTKMNHPTDLPASSFFSHSPATVGSAAWMGSAALMHATNPAASNIEMRVFKAKSPRYDLYGHRATICPFQGAPGQHIRSRSIERRDSVAIPPWSGKTSPPKAIPGFACCGAPPRGHQLRCSYRGECGESVDCVQARAVLPHVADFPTPLPQLIARPVALHRDRHRHRLFRRARNGPTGPLFGVRADRHHDDRSRIRRSMDHAAWDEVLRRPFHARRAHAI